MSDEARQPTELIAGPTEAPLTIRGAKTAAPAEPSDVRFSMRGLMLTMTAVAVVAAVLGSTARKLGPASLGDVFVMWGIATAIVVCRVVYCAWVRIRLERSAGRVQCTLAPRGVFGWARSAWMSVLIGFLWIGGGVYYLAVAAIVARGSPPGPIPGLICGALISIGIASAWWNRAVQLREHGVLHGLRLLRWTHITRHSWDDETLSLEGVDQRHRDVQMVAVASAGTLDAAKRLVERKVKPGGWRGLEAMLREQPRDAKLPLVPIQGGKDVTVQGMLSAFAAYVVLCVFVFTAFRPWGRPTSEFMRGVGFGIAAALLILVQGSRRVRDAGGPIVRLKRKLDWPTALVTAGVTFGCYYVNQQLLFPNVAIGTLFGIISGMGASVMIGLASRDKIDLCENGVVLVRWTFFPWSLVRLLKWNRTGNGRLLIRSGWQRLAAKVPAEHREVVDRVLREKVGRVSPPSGADALAAAAQKE